MALWYPAFVAVLLTGIGTAWMAYGSSFDWQYQTISTLLSRRDNPRGYQFLGATLAIAILMLLPIRYSLHTRLSRMHSAMGWASYILLSIGIWAAFAAAVERLFPLTSRSHPKTHEAIALVAFLGLYLGVLGYTRLLRGLGPGANDRLANMSQVIGLGVLFGAMGSQVYLSLTPGDLGWVGPNWRDRGVSVFLSFAFWEWIGCAWLVVHLYALLWVSAGRPPTPMSTHAPQHDPRGSSTGKN